jgi:hypothetical protein
MAGFDISGAESSGSVTTVLVTAIQEYFAHSVKQHLYIAHQVRILDIKRFQ